MAVWLALAAAWGAPPAAAIDRYTDSRGVIHISNVGGKRAPQPTSVAAEPTPSISLPEPAAAPPPAPASSPEAVTPEVNAPAATLDADPVEPRGLAAGTAPAPEQTNAAQPEELAPALATEPVVSNPINPIAWTPVAAPPQAGPPPVAATTLPSPEGDIRRFRDRQGVLHITNVPPPEKVAPPALLAREGDTHTSMSTLALPDSVQETPALPVKRAAWNDDSPPLKLISRKAAASKNLPAISGVIHRYRDAQGVWHITNVVREERAVPTPSLVQARARPGEVNAAAGGYGYVPALAEAETAALAFRKAAWAKGDRNPPQPLKAKRQSAANSGAWTGETLTRYRDAKGVVHIKSVTPPEPRLAALPPRPPRHGAPPAPVVAGEQTNPAPPDAAASPEPAPLNSGAGIAAFRDPKGRLVIRNRDPEIMIGQFPRGGAAVTAFEGLIAEAAQAYALPVALIKAVITVESNFVSWAVSPKGAMGLMQLMPGTAAFLGVQDAFDPRENILGGCRYLRLLLDSFGGSLPLALAAYNAGYQRVISSGYQVPPIKETQEFVTNVLGRYYTGERPLQLPWPWT